MLSYTCAKCGVELMCLKNDVPVVHFLNNDRQNGIDVLAYGDLWGCSVCGCKVVLGLGEQVLGMELSDKAVDYVLDNRFVEVKR